MSISTDLYRTFLGVGLHLSFSKAAKDLGVSQSAISQSIKQLEKELNITLFERTTKSVSFTTEGKELFEMVAKAFSILDNGVMQLKERMAHEQESLKLAATDSICRHYLLPYFKKWQDQEHETGLQITNAASPQCVEMVENREAQIAIVNTYKGLESNPQLEVIELETVQDIFVGGSFYKGMGVIDLNRLMQEPLLLLTHGAASRSFFDELTHNACKKPSFELGSLDVLLDLIEINMGISLVPDVLVKQKIKEGRLVEIKTDITVPPRKVALVRSRLMPVSQGAAKFIDLLLRK